MVDLGTLGGSSRAHDINNSGQVVGTYLYPYGSSWLDRAFIWTAGEGMVEIPRAEWDSATWATAIDESGGVVGGAEDDYWELHVWSWNRPTIGCPYYQGWAEEVNDGGSAVGSCKDDEGDFEAVVWGPQGGAPTFLEIPAFSDACDDPDACSTAAGDINERGQIVGSVTVRGQGGGPVLWSNGEATLLDLRGADSGTANALNDQGQIVGTVQTAGIPSAVMWLVPTE